MDCQLISIELSTQTQNKNDFFFGGKKRDVFVHVCVFRWQITTRTIICQFVFCFEYIKDDKQQVISSNKYEWNMLQRQKRKNQETERESSVFLTLYSYVEISLQAHTSHMKESRKQHIFFKPQNADELTNSVYLIDKINHINIFLSVVFVVVGYHRAIPIHFEYFVIMSFYNGCVAYRIFFSKNNKMRRREPEKRRCWKMCCFGFSTTFKILSLVL